METLKPPEKIYLQWDPEASHFGQLTWADHRIDDTDLEFLRADVVEVCEETASKQGYRVGFAAAGEAIATELGKL